jgi:hypothetical protein
LDRFAPFALVRLAACDSFGTGWSSSILALHPVAESGSRQRTMLAARLFISCRPAPRQRTRRWFVEGSIRALVDNFNFFRCSRLTRSIQRSSRAKPPDDARSFGHCKRDAAVVLGKRVWMKVCVDLLRDRDAGVAEASEEVGGRVVGSRSRVVRRVRSAGDLVGRRLPADPPRGENATRYRSSNCSALCYRLARRNGGGRWRAGRRRPYRVGHHRRHGAG